MSQVNLTQNECGAGVYFARDARVAHFCIRDVRGKLDATLKLVLARVVFGLCAQKHAIKSSKKDSFGCNNIVMNVGQQQNWDVVAAACCAFIFLPFSLSLVPFLSLFLCLFLSVFPFSFLPFSLFF